MKTVNEWIPINVEERVFFDNQTPLYNFFFSNVVWLGSLFNSHNRNVLDFSVYVFDDEKFVFLLIAKSDDNIPVQVIVDKSSKNFRCIFEMWEIYDLWDPASENINPDIHIHICEVMELFRNLPH